MEYVVVVLVALFASGLTFYSGFGLGTLLLPAFALLFPVPTAVAMTAIVHLLNNLFKLVLVGRYAHLRIALRFGLPAVVMSFAGARLLLTLGALAPWASYRLGSTEFTVEPVGAVIGILIVVFAMVELMPDRQGATPGTPMLAAGGAASGFFGGLSGHQGALRSAVLMRFGLDQRAFVGTGVVIACAVDVARISIYGKDLSSIASGQPLLVLGLAVLAAFAGAFAGSRLLGKVTMRAVRTLVAIMLLLIGLAMGAGLL